MNYEYLKYLVYYLIAINIIGFLSMFVDKVKAEHRMWRIPERTLFLIAFLLGATGSFIGMKVCRHKTLHPQFKYGIPTLIILNLIIIGYVVYKFILV